MGNRLDELNPEIKEDGLDTNVIVKRLPVEVSTTTKILDKLLFIGGIAIMGIIALLSDTSPIAKIIMVLIGFLPGGLYLYAKVNARNRLMQLEQRIQANASTIDNYLEQRVQIMKNAIPIAEKAINLDKEVFSEIAQLRSTGKTLTDEERNNLSASLDRVSLTFENYPELHSHASIADLMQQNSYLQKEITAARELYNNSVLQWNTEIFIWPAKQAVAAELGYTTKIPFIASKAIKEQATMNFFE